MAKVLIVDDEPTARFMSPRFVRDLGHWVIESSNGQRASEVLWDNHDIDLLITDLRMPELTGEGFARKPLTAAIEGLIQRVLLPRELSLPITLQSWARCHRYLRRSLRCARARGSLTRKDGRRVRWTIP